MNDDLIAIPPTLTFKSIREEHEWQDPRLAPILREIVGEAAGFAFEQFGWIPCITSIYRTMEENQDALAKTTIHCVWRAVDLRTKLIDSDWVKAVGDHVNAEYTYDAKRPLIPIAYWKPHGNGPHLHLQCHFTTAKKQIGA